MDDIPWIYVVMIFIAFLSWVSNRVKEAAAYRRQMRAERAAAERARRTTQAPEYNSPYRQEPPQRQPERSKPEPEPVEPQSYEDIFRELQRRVSGELEPTQQKTPPPLPSQSQEAEQPVGAMPKKTSAPVQPSPASGVTERKKRKKSTTRGETATALTGILRNGNQLRNALILKEVLDKPVSMRR
ncbi:hypothetical protein N9406_01670 [Verrucomicrobiales bacterium]|jgi:hypothetical protein|nr:hypothetical protein [Verrucomicrobiales bacterium]MDA9921801.1 hypothetical protein [Verrucomicrobiales bacterium]MDB2495902.1 hypothetical protein [Verrucomicrobiales bacterium]MDB3939642.1 hypothetical protein [Verrucomicrobiales bacterium]